MLRRRGRPFQEMIPEWSRALEPALSAALSDMFETELTAVVRFGSEPSRASGSELNFRHVNGQEFTLILGGTDVPGSRVEHFSRLVRLAKYFHQVAPGRCSVLSSRTIPDSFSGTFDLITTRHEQAVNVLIETSGPIELPCPATPNAGSNFFIMPKVPVVLELDVPGGVERGCGRYSLRADVRLRSALCAAPLEGRMSAAGSTIQIFIDKERPCMESTGDTCLPITLSLGEIEISLDEARRLRPGMCLEFERPQCFEGMLLLAGAPWARARVRVDERVVTLEVLGPVETDTRQKAGSQETSG